MQRSYPLHFFSPCLIFSHSLPHKTQFVNTLFENFLLFFKNFSFSIFSAIFFVRFVLKICKKNRGRLEKIPLFPFLSIPVFFLKSLAQSHKRQPN